MNNLHLTNFDVCRDSRGVVTAILNVADSSVNLFNETVLHDLDELILAVEDDQSVRAVVFRSGKESGFLAGADLHAIQSLSGAEDAEAICRAGQDLFLRLQTMRVPTVAVIKGVCLGGGLEFALACRFRIVVDDPRTLLGLPEVELGLLPGWGGTQRLPRQVGLSAALPMLLTGKKVGANEAYQIRLADAICKPDGVDAAVDNLLGLNAGADSFVDNHHVATTIVRRMESKTAESDRANDIASWFKDQTLIGRWLVMRAARRGIASRSRNYPALTSILNAVAAGLGRGDDRGFAVEREEFGKLVTTEVHRNLLGLFFQRERACKSETWIPGMTTRPRSIKSIGIVGGGVMGIGIAHFASLRGFDVVLKEVNADLLDAGLCHIRDLFNESVRKHVLSASDASTKFGAITATTDWNAFADVDLAIEAVTERLGVKQSVFKEMETHCPPHAILATNTSALSIHAISESLQNPNRVLGLHFFNPVHRMQLVEVVRPDAARNQDVAALVDFVKKLGKVPLVTADHPGFVVNRILFPYLDEAVRLHCEGVPTDEIDRPLKQFGMPMGPLELLDQVGLDVAAHVASSLNGLSKQSSPTGERLREMVSWGEIGRKGGRGFYLYLESGGMKACKTHLNTKVVHVSANDIRDRILLRLVNEAAKCLEENVVAEPWMIDLGLVLGTGFAPHLGGPLRMCEATGYGEIVAKLDYFQKTLGERFAPSRWLVDQIEHPSESQTVCR